MTVYTASQKTAGVTGLPGQDPSRPWIDPVTYASAVNAGLAGKINHVALEASRAANAGIKV
jgi:hypothetical protein